MPKLRNRPAPSPRDVDRSVTELGELASSDRGVQRDRLPRNREEAEDAAMPEQRAVYEKIMGKSGKRPAARRQAQQQDERARLDDDEPEEEAEEEAAPPKKNARSRDDDEAEDLDDDTEADEEDAGEGKPRVSQKKLDGALNALRRAKVPKSVYDKLDDDDVVGLAGSLAGYQSNADRVLQSKDETIRALQVAVAASRGGQAKADGESPGTEQPPEEDLTRAAEGLARALGVENDASTKKALEDYARAVRPKAGKSTSAEAARIERLQATVRDLVLDQGVRRVRRNYSEHLSDPEGVRALKKRAIALSADDGYEDDVPRLFKDAARSLWGDPERPEETGRARARRGSATPTPSRRTEHRDTAEPSEGTEEHDRKVYSRITGASRRGAFATRR